jgi:tetratricopeptide (TPR) repeat protein
MTRTLLSVATLLLFACASSKPVPPAPKPRRPKPKKVEAPPVAPTDCQRVDPKTLPAAVPYVERSITESNNLANEGVELLNKSRSRTVEPVEREELFGEAVRKLVTALAADPYNVHATYNLAAAYARIGRRQCALNLLERIVLLRKLPSYAPAIEAKLDRLLGRGKYKGNLDPDFEDLRDDHGFRELVKEFRGSL